MGKRIVWVMALACALPGAAAAQPAGQVEAEVTPLDGTQIGVRVGGYGFREQAAADAMDSGSTTGWNACRMNGIGVFADYPVSRVFFVGAGLDTYFSESFPTGEASGSYDTPIDRVSGILSVAAGARMFPDALISPYVQLGVGGELTRVRLPALGLEDTAALPMAFFGAGATLRLGDHARLGAHLRVNAMGYYDDAQFQRELSPEAELATQAQFFAAYEL